MPRYARNDGKQPAKGEEFMRSIAFTAAAILASGIASPIEATPAGPQVWQVDWEGSRCSISTGDPANMFLALWVTPGEPRPELYLVAPADRLKSKAEKIKVTLAPSGATFDGYRYTMMGKGGTAVVDLSSLGEEFPAAFGKASEVRLGGFPQPISIPVVGSDQAMAALKGCVDEKLPTWGIDAKAFNALRSPPRDPGHYDWISSDDYPHEAIEKNEGGEVVVRMNISEKGKVTDCAVVSSSGSTALDKVPCLKAMKNGRFIPAIGADGKPTAAMRTLRVTFHLESM